MAQGKIFAEATHLAVLRRMRLIREKDRPELIRRVAIAILLGWVPLALLSLLHASIFHDAAQLTFFTDVATHARLLLAVPLLIAAEYIIFPRLEAIRQHFTDASMVGAADRERFQATVRDCHRRSAGVWPSGTIVIITYALVLLMMMTIPADIMPAWQRSPFGLLLSLAGWWHMLISLPLLLGLLLAWLWRLAIWAYFLGKVARLGLRLVASHPDKAGGLQFIAYSPRVFWPFALAIGIIVAGTMANNVFHNGVSPLEHKATPIVTAVIVAILLAFPPLLFGRQLLNAWRTGVLKYGDLASRVGQQLEDKWMGAGSRVSRETLAEPDFSATTDLYQVTGNVYAMRLMLFDYQSVAAVAIVTLLPFAPIWLTAIPLQTLVKNVVGLLF